MSLIEQASIAILEMIAQTQATGSRKQEVSDKSLENMAQTQETISQKQEASDKIVENISHRQEASDRTVQLQKAKLRSHEGQLEDIHQDRRALIAEAVSAFTTSLEVKFALFTGQNEAPGPPQSSDTVSNEIFLRLRNCTKEVEGLAAEFDGYKRIWSADEGNRIVSRAITTCITATLTFLIALIGYFSGGKSYTAFGRDGLLYAILERLPPVFIEVIEILETKTSFGAFMFNELSASVIATDITEGRRKGENIANKESSRSHVMVRCEDKGSGRLLGMLIDVAGPELWEKISSCNPKCLITTLGFRTLWRLV